MNKIVLKQFYEKIDEESKVSGIPKETAFIKWYIESYFGKDARYEITDGTDDGGIDAIVHKGSSVTLIQSKYSEGLNTGLQSSLDPSFYAQFDYVAKTFSNPSLFEHWVKSVGQNQARHYRQVFNDRQNKRIDLNWRFITLMSPSPSSESKLQFVNRDNFTYDNGIAYLYELTVEDIPPADEFVLNFRQSMSYFDPELELNTYVVIAKLKDFLKYMETDTEDRFFAKNVRNDLKTDINKDIVQTFENQPHEFWYSNNGIHIICTNANIRGEKIYLKFPYVINGSQTLHSIKNQTSKRPEDCWVLARIFEIPVEKALEQNYKQLINNIIFRTNQQNKIYKYDLRANDRIQIQLAKNLSNAKIFYERRRGDWDACKMHYKPEGFRPLTSKMLAQILASCDPDFGPSETRISIENLFSDKLYHKLFKEEENFEITLSKIKLFFFIQNSIYNHRKKSIEWGSRNYLLHPILAVMWSAENYNLKLNTINLLIDLNYKNKKYRKYDIVIHKLFDRIWRIWKQENKKDATMSLANFVKNSRLMKKVIKEFENTGFYKKVQTINKEIIEIDAKKAVRVQSFSVPEEYDIDHHFKKRLGKF